MIINEPKTAVIIGTYNRGDLLRNSLYFYEEQNMPLDIIVMDDGSTDNTYNICKDSSCNIHYFYLGDNIGWRDSASYLNEGIKRALHV